MASISADLDLPAASASSGSCALSSCVVTVAKQSPHGEGIAFHEGKELYIPQALVGEVLEVRIGEPFAQGSKRCPAELLAFVQPSPMRVSAAEYECPHYELCGGCQLMHVKYEEQLRLKQESIAAALDEVERAVGSGSNCKGRVSLRQRLREVVPCSSRPCRFKSLRYFAQKSKDEESLELGFFAPRSHELVAVDNCPLEPKRFAELSQSLLSCCRRLKLHAYADGAAGAGAESDAADSASGAAVGALRAVLWRMGDQGAVLGSLIVSGPLPEDAKQALALWAAESQVASFSLGYNAKAGNALFTADTELLYGESSITKTLLGLKFEVYAPTFLQVNYEICEALYQAAIAHCASASDGADGEQVGLDLCCGVGTMSLALASHFAEVIGVEIVPEAIAAAERNAALNDVSNVRFLASDLKKVLPKLIREQRKAGKHIGGVIADPARVGLGAENVKALAALSGPCKLSLIFCALPALKRDLPELLRCGFEVDSVQGFDMFPHSSHVETMVLLSRKA